MLRFVLRSSFYQRNLIIIISLLLFNRLLGLQLFDLYKRVVSHSLASGWPELEVVFEVDCQLAILARSPREEVHSGECDRAIAFLARFDPLDELESHCRDGGDVALRLAAKDENAVALIISLDLRVRLLDSNAALWNRKLSSAAVKDSDDICTWLGPQRS